jgi:predicted RNA-binding Zn ribbon-like protein
MTAFANRFPMIAGELCVDFANTIYPPQHSLGSLRNWDDLVDLLEAGGAIPTDDVAPWRRFANGNSQAAEAAFRTAIGFRRVLRELLEALTNDGRAPVAAIAAINELMRKTAAGLQLVPEGKRWRTQNARHLEDPLILLAPVARSAAKLVLELPKVHVRKCENPDCVLYFYDDSPTSRRRWCSMEMCGNRAKVAAHYQREKKAAVKKKVRN